jgi:L-iditol 2-dehydrogenase
MQAEQQAQQVLWDVELACKLDPGELRLEEKPVPVPGRGEVLVRIDAVAICATDLEIIKHGPPAMIDGGLPFNKHFTPGHEYMGTVVEFGAGVGEYRIG